MKNKLNEEQSLINNKISYDYKNPDNLLDSDNDGIPDEWEINGYTVEDKILVPWDEERHSKMGLTKYVSDPYNSNTSGDPYSDLEKVLNQIDGGILDCAYNPLVAASPAINVELKKIIISNNFNIGKNTIIGNKKEDSKSIHVGTSNSSIESDSVDASIELHVSSNPLACGANSKVTANHSNTAIVSKNETNSTTSGKDSTNAWEEDLNLNTSSTAFLSANIIYQNFGTAPIYNMALTLNFILGVGKNSQTFATITSKSNNIANMILPNDSYPNKKHNAITWNTSDDFSSQPIALNYKQWKMFDEGEKIQIQTTQFNGFYKKYNFYNEANVNFNQNWSFVNDDIKNRTACITISFLNGVKEQRHVASRKQKNYWQQSIPILNLGQAIKIAFTGAQLNGNDEETLKYKTLNENNFRFVMDEKTYNIIESSQGFQKNIYKMPLYQGMNILIIEQYTNKELFDLVSEFVKKFNEQNPYDLLECYDLLEYDDVRWKDVLNVFKNKLLEKFGLHEFNKIKNLNIDSPYAFIMYSAQEKPITNSITFEIGEFKYTNPKIYFKNIWDSEMFLTEITKYLSKYNQDDPLSLKSIDPTKTWKMVTPYLEYLIKPKIGTKNFKKIKDFTLSEDWKLINENVLENGLESKDLYIEIVGQARFHLTIYFKDIGKFQEKIIIDYNLEKLTTDVSGPSWGLTQEITNNQSEEFKILEIKKYNQKDLTSFIKKYPKIEIEFDSHVLTHEDVKRDEIKGYKEYKTNDLFKDEKLTTNTISHYYDQTFWGYVQGWTEIRTEFKYGNFYIQTAASAGGKGSLNPESHEKAFIEIKKITFKQN